MQPPQDNQLADDRGPPPQASIRGCQHGAEARDTPAADMCRETLTPSLPESEFYSEAQIHHRVKELVSRISRDRDDGALLRDTLSMLTKRLALLEADVEARQARKAQALRSALAPPAPGSTRNNPAPGQDAPALKAAAPPACPAATTRLRTPAGPRHATP